MINYNNYFAMNTFELKERSEGLKEDLLRLLEEWHYMDTVLRPRLMFIYETIFGDLETEIRKKSEISSKKERRAQLMKARSDRGEKITEQTLKFIDAVVENEYIKKQEMSRNSRAANSRPGFVSGDFNSRRFTKTFFEFKKETDVPKLYRTIVKQLHPDLVGESENFKRYWQNVQDAYQKKNVDRLKLFFQTLCDEKVPEKTLRVHPEENLRTAIRELERNIREEQMRIQKMKSKEPFILEIKLKDKFWILRHKRKLKDRIFNMDRKILESSITIKRLKRMNIRSNQANQQNVDLFGADFFKQKYYKGA